jgi:hypothetical protein
MNGFIAQAELYDPKTGTFSPTGSLATARVYHSATLLSDGRVLIVGGRDPKPNQLASAELYDPVSGKFSAVGSMKTGRRCIGPQSMASRRSARPQRTESNVLLSRTSSGKQANAHSMAEAQPHWSHLSPRHQRLTARMPAGSCVVLSSHDDPTRSIAPVSSGRQGNAFGGGSSGLIGL